jgi:hypothetical protein
MLLMLSYWRAINPNITLVYLSRDETLGKPSSFRLKLTLLNLHIIDTGVEE